MTRKEAIELIKNVFAGTAEEQPSEKDINTALEILAEEPKPVEKVVEAKQPVIKGYTVKMLEEIYKNRKVRLCMTPDFLKELRRLEAEKK